jgi:beta-galactosidase
VAFDFATTIRREGDADDINTKGMITYDRKVKKDVFFYYKANWSDVPTVHVASRRYVNRAYAVTDVRVYSNAPVTELSVNGRTIGKLTDCPDRVCTWRNVRLAAGTNDVTARGRFGSKVVADKISWKLAPEQLRSVRIDAGALMAASSTNGRFGSDNFFDGGEAGTVIKPADYGKPAVPVKIANTTDADLVATFRRGKFAYTVPVANGRYDVRLSFVEPSAAAGERMFDVMANGTAVLRNLDIAATAGGPMAMVARTFPVDVRDGQLRLSFAPTKGDAIVSAIEVIAQQ